MSKTSRKVLRRFCDSLDGLLALHPRTAELYLRTLGAILRSTGRFPLKENLISTVTSSWWPEIRFKAKTVRLPGNVEIKLVPHPGEFDFRALFSKNLNYELPVFRVLAGRLQRYDAILEIGANVGVYTLFFAKYLERLDRSVPIFAFEPSRAAYARLLENLLGNQAKNVLSFNAAVARHSGVVPFFEPNGHLTNGSLRRDFAEIFASDVEETMVLAVDGVEVQSLLTGYQALLLKIDVEGAEDVVLESLESLIEMTSPDIVLEVLDYNVDRLNGLSILKNRYRFFQMREEGLRESETLTAFSSRDYLLVPRARAEFSTRDGAFMNEDVRRQVTTS